MTNNAELRIKIAEILIMNEPEESMTEGDSGTEVTVYKDYRHIVDMVIAAVREHHGIPNE